MLLRQQSLFFLFEKSPEMAYPNWNRYSSWTLCTKSTSLIWKLTPGRLL